MGEKGNENARGSNGGNDVNNSGFFERLASGSASGSSDSSGGGNRESATSGGISGNGSEGSGNGSEVSDRASPGNSPGGISADSRETFDAGSGGSGRVDYTGRRGRHPRNCDCGNCINRRTAEAAGIDPNQARRDAAREQRKRRVSQENFPESVDWADIFPGMQEGRAPKVDDLFSLAYSTLFEVVKFARAEEHWSITKEEANKLGKVSVSCLNTIPAAAKGKIEAKVSKYLPWCALIGFGIVITAPRVVISMEAAKEKKRNRYPIPFPNVQRKEEPAYVPPVEPNTPETVTGGTSEVISKSSFPPGHGANFPRFDFEIPSPTDRKPS